jgi:flagellar protein FliS
MLYEGIDMHEESIHHYRETQIKTASKGKLIVMLYDGVIRFLDSAIDAIPKKKYDVANNSIVKAQDIISELILALDMDAGDFSNNLLSIYSFLNTKLIDANMKKDVEPLKFVQRMISELREAWIQITRNSPNPDLDEMKKGGGIDVAG